MRLKQIELYGYKSFATRSAFRFPDGITAVVGPNGCGKSNIADAVRWVMGEQRSLNLRARSTEDLIFAGTRHRSRLGMAEVIMTLDNSEGWLPIDYTEVTIGRRAFRSGDNEYLLNGNRVRYRDILDLLGRAGLGRSSYVIIGQGMVDAALSLRPQARRVLFEESAGITPDLRKRDETLRRIQETERNLERAQDILSELHPRASSLRRQAERAEEHMLLSQDLQELQRIWYGHQWQRYQRELSQAQEEQTGRQAQLKSQRAYTHSLAERNQQIAQQQRAQRELIDQLGHEQAGSSEIIAALRREAAVADERALSYEQQGETIGVELESLGARREIVQDEIDRAAQELAQHESDHTASADQLRVARLEMEEVESASRRVQQQTESEEEELVRSRSLLSSLGAQSEQLIERRKSVSVEHDEASARLALLRERSSSLQAQTTQLLGGESSLVEALEQSREEQSQLEKAATISGAQLREVEGQLSALRADRDQLTARAELLARLRQELTGYLPGVREVLSARPGLKGILGIVANLIDTPAELEQAIEAALGSRLQNIITESWEHAEEAISHLKRTQAGWATFLPLDTLRAPKPLHLTSDPGLAGVASQLVRFEERLRPAIELLLGRVVLVNDLATARRLLKRRTGASLLVTLEGETIQPSGALTGGALRRSTPLLAQERERRQLPEQITSVETEIAEKLEVHDSQRKDRHDLEHQLEEQGRASSRTRGQLESHRERLATHRQDVRGVERECEWLETRIQRALDETNDLDDRETRLELKIARTREHQRALDVRVAELKQSIRSTGTEQIRKKVAELETRTAVAQRTLSSQRRLLESHEVNLNQISTQIEQKHEQAAELIARSVALQAQREQLQSRLNETAAQLAELASRLDPAKEASALLVRQHNEGERLHTQSLERFRETELDVDRASLACERIRDQQSALAREIEAALGPIDLPETISHQLRLSLGDDIVELPNVVRMPPGLGDEIRQLKARLRRLGNVNADAPEEYDRLLERQTFMQSQVSDLRGAIAALHEVIQELDTIIEQGFLDTIQKVDEAFGEYFSRLFRGGSARLTLSEPDSPNTTGVDIIAHPPGKRAQSLALLSGGERSLTAVALLFALLKVNPVPFCFLDEVDAALDEANVGRFRDLLVEHAQTTQFIVITHNRTTVEASSTVYGISMGEQGVSECVSLKLDKVEPVDAAEAIAPEPTPS